MSLVWLVLGVLAETICAQNMDISLPSKMIIVHLESCFGDVKTSFHCSVFGLHQVLRGISVSLAAKCFTVFTS